MNHNNPATPSTSTWTKKNTDRTEETTQKPVMVLHTLSPSVLLKKGSHVIIQKGKLWGSKPHFNCHFSECNVYIVLFCVET
jgi:hypothetical protein